MKEGIECKHSGLSQLLSASSQKLPDWLHYLLPFWLDIVVKAAEEEDEQVYNH